MGYNPPAPTWLEIVAHGDSVIIYRDSGVRVSKITYMGWFALQVKWHQYTPYEAVLRAIGFTVPKGAKLRGVANPSAYQDHTWLFDEVYNRNYLQWEPIQETEEMPLAQVS